MKRALRFLMAGAAVLGMAAMSGPALAMDGSYISYYADSSYTFMVGAEMTDCSGQHQLIGTPTPWYLVTTWQC